MPKPAGGPRSEDIQAETAGQTLRRFEAWMAELSQTKFVFRLYVAGNTARSRQAIANVREICERHLAGQYELDVVDVYQQPEIAKSADLIALPTLIKELPFPPRRFVGDMSNTERIVVGLKLEELN